MFIWGSGHKSLHIALENVAACGRCKSTNRTASIEYDYDHIFWIFKGLKNKVIQLTCATCGQSEFVDKKAEKQLIVCLDRNPIPFMDRHGALVLIAILIAWVSFALLFPCAVNPNSTLCVGQ